MPTPLFLSIYTTIYCTPLYVISYSTMVKLKGQARYTLGDLSYLYEWKTLVWGL